jgi:hypothetical protein
MTVQHLPILGKVMSSVVVDKVKEKIIFTQEDGTSHVMHHQQDCCESVGIEQVDGDIEDLIGQPLVIAEVASETVSDDFGITGWTFYRFATVNGYVTVRWSGRSNGYYSIGVYFDEVLGED